MVKALIKDTAILTRIFYGLIGIASSLAFFLVLYWALRIDSSITNLILNTYTGSLYFWLYVILTAGTIILFGINASFLVYRFRKFGPPKIKMQGGTALGSLIGMAASACPVCGSTILYAIGITAGLAVFPFQGLELKALSFILMALPIWLMRRDMKKLESNCEKGICPAPRDPSFKEEKDKLWLIALLVAVVVLIFVGWNMLKTEPIIVKF